MVTLFDTMLHFSYKCIINIQLFIQDNPSSSTQVTQNDLNEFFSLKLDYGMIIFVSIAAILMAYFMIKHWLFATRKSFELSSKPSINSDVDMKYMK